ncbi:MAG: hypothetical protein NT154_26220 [Verrucomicrobia bacterium]|nr:hypothetical protein [Verrucomicrobiota bacterium]
MTTVNGTLNVGSHVYNDGGTVIISPGGSVNQEPLAHEVAHVAQSRGVTTINGTLNLPLNVDGGTVNGSGTINGNAGINGGVLSPGNSPGTLTVSNDFALNDGGTLLIELAGRETNQFDLLKVGGSAGLAGGLIVRVLPGFAPAIGDQFPILTTAERSGEFSRLEVPPGIAVTYNPTGVVLVVTSAVHVQIMGPALSGGDLVFSFATATNQSYTVQFNDDLATTNWLLQTNLTGTGSLLYFTSPVTNAPQRFFRVRQP